MKCIPRVWPTNPIVFSSKPNWQYPRGWRFLNYASILCSYTFSLFLLPIQSQPTSLPTLSHFDSVDERDGRFKVCPCIYSSKCRWVTPSYTNLVCKWVLAQSIVTGFTVFFALLIFNFFFILINKYKNFCLKKKNRLKKKHASRESIYKQIVYYVHSSTKEGVCL